jgi:hypothetical protein
MSVCLPVLTEQLCCHWMVLHKTWYLRIFRKSVEKNKVSLKSHKDNRYISWRPTYVHLLWYLAKFFSEREIFQTKAVEKIKSHILRLMTFFLNIMLFMTRCEKIWNSQTGHRWQYHMAHDGTVTQATDDNIIWHMMVQATDYNIIWHMMVQSDRPKMTISYGAWWYSQTGHRWQYNMVHDGRDRQATDDNIIQQRKDLICMPECKNTKTRT